MRKIISAAVGVVALSVGGLAPAAYAEDGPSEGFILASSPWQALDTGPGVVWTPGLSHESELSTFVGPTTVDLNWSDDVLDASLGTSAETEDLGAAVTAGAQISVDYELLHGASPVAGAVRLFAQVDDTPLLVAAAPADATSGGTLTLAVPAGGTLGWMGLVYDTSNGGVEGTVRFSDLTVDGEPVLFVPPVEPTIEQPTCTDPGVITIPDAPGYQYALEGTAVPAGDHDVSPGDHEVTAAIAADDAVVHTWVLTAHEPTGCPPGDDDGTDDGGESGTDDGGESGTDDGGESGTDDGGESGTDDGTESGGDDDGSPSPTPTTDDCEAYENAAAWCDPAQDDYDCPDIDDAHKPIQLVDPDVDPFLLDADNDGLGCEGPSDDGGDDAGDDGAADDGDDLPDTGSESLLPWAGAALLVMGAMLALVARHRRGAVI